MVFADREKELKALEQRFSSDNFEFVVIYGRRRIGKTSLILEALKDKEHVYYLATEAKNNLAKFKRTVEAIFPSVRHVREDWESLLLALKDKVIVFDEFPYLIKEDSSIVSVFQKIVDSLRDSKTKLVVLGSSISMMEDDVLSYRSPLYGRRSGSIRLGELKFSDLRHFGFDLIEAVRVYGFSGGVPYYITKVNTPFYGWINWELKKADSFIKDEVDFLLKYEFSEIATYKEILFAISLGKNTLGEIRDFVKVKGEVSSYIRKLQRIGLVIKEIPVTEGITSKRGRYRIADNFTNFWFRFVYPNLSMIEEALYELPKRDYEAYLGRVFERIAEEYVKEKYTVNKIGRFWWKDIEIDLLALGGENVAGECKWSENVNPKELLHALKQKLKAVGVEVDRFILFAKSFSRQEEEAELVDLNELNEWYKGALRPRT
ncbi:ATPase [Candidatus Marsarchaeota G2 archaeon ECH_B_2]|uniref:ATPase n=3 Tax=Candidatus Marsarchaeota group 2 TaxID=2203771 RepID=A0A2R6B4W3_9ARCH|nr:MAG: ATPase [Candidatus Marsarchaeota G2 archaeon ECH_B_2]PSN97930.1 MAG: ATPase [Candidatus Marsarchaeota G2 archaeon ECH_B_3]PSN99462.1 MAG: ATPase [Candidatus Marsarchaeota G2 archaeon ECH_B_1]